MDKENGTIDSILATENPISKEDVYQFSALDYGIFATMLIASASIGIYYGFISKRKQNNPAEYIFGNRQMSITPIATSLIASYISGTTMLGVPSDVYAHGSQYVMCFICMILVALALIYIYIPVFYDLGHTSCFTYLEKRFDHRAKVTASLVFALSCTVFIPIAIYIPAMAFSQVSGIEVGYINVVVSILCIFYTTIGGLRAVVWTDTIQFTAILGAIVTIIIVGTSSVGGFRKVFEAADRGERLVFFNLNPSPFIPSSFWTLSIGLSTMWISLKSVNQGTIQRCLSLPDKKKVKLCVWIFIIGVSILKIASCYVGILLYATYENCDPLSSGKIKKLDQILPYYTMDISKNVPGLPGLFIAGLFAAALSSMSTDLNALAATIYEDLIKPFRKNDNEKTASNIMKLIVVISGCVQLGLVFLVDKLGSTILQLAYSLYGLTSGTLLGIFTIGMISTKVNTKGIIAGSIVSIICIGTILVGAQSSPKLPPLPFKTDECSVNLTINSTEIWLQKSEEYEKIFWLFRISFMYYALIGAIILVLVAYPVSIITGGCGPVDDNLLITFRRKKPIIYKTVELALAKTY